MKRILIITNNLKQSSYRLRVEALIEPLRRRGYAIDVQVRSKSYFARRRMLASADRYDVVLLQRKTLDPCDARLLRRKAKRILYDVDDAIMYPQKPVGWYERWRITRRFKATAAIADRIVVGNEYLAERFGAINPNVTILPTVVEAGHYRVKTHAATDGPRLVWIGTKSTVPYVREFLPALEEAARRVPGLRLIITADATIEKARIPIEFVPWSFEGEAATLIRGDIGIAPTPSDPWTLGKCGFKIVQYMAAGLPVVASPVGANAELVTEGVTGLLPKTHAEWVEAIVRLAGDVSLRAGMGRAGRERVEKELNLDYAADFWIGLIGE